MSRTGDVHNSCDVCSVSFSSEKEMYEHDISLEHHRKFQEKEKYYGRPPIHFCSICDRGGISGVQSWISHTHGKAHKSKLASFYQYFKIQNKPQLFNSLAHRLDSHSGSECNKPTDSHYSATHKTELLENKSDIQTSKQPYPSTACVDSKVSKINKDSRVSNVSSNFEPNANGKSESEGGMMLNILQSIHPESANKTVDCRPKAYVKSATHRSKYHESFNRSHDGRKDRFRSRYSYVAPKTAKDFVGYDKSQSWSASDTAITTNITETITTASKTIINTSTVTTSTIATTPITTINANTAANFPVNQTNVCENSEQFISGTSIESNSVQSSELRCMEQALSVSQELQTLRIKQSELETKLREITAELQTIKSKRRELKQLRANLLQGLAASDSDTEFSVEIPTSRVAGGHNINLNLLKAGEKRVASIAPLDSTCHPHIETKSTSTSNAPNFPLHSSVKNQRSNLVYLSSNSDTILPSVVSYANAPQSKCSTSVFSKMDALSDVKLTSSSLCQTSPTSQTVSAVNSNTGGVDLERLTLIRQALQSPDSWKFTFEDVDQMLKQTAAKAAAQKTTNQSSELLKVSSDSPKSPALVESDGDKPIPVVRVKGEPDVFEKKFDISEQPLGQSTNHSVIKTSTHSALHLPSTMVPPENPISDCPVIKPHESSSSFSSSDDEHKSLHKSSKRLRKTKKSSCTFDFDTKMSKSEIIDSEDNKVSNNTFNETELCWSSSVENTNTSNDSLKIGEFHAFNGSTTAVIDMVFRPSTSSIFVGGQNGCVNQYDLKNHHCIFRRPARDASVTRMGLNIKETSLFVGYYDGYFAEYSPQSGVLIHNKSFLNRIEALAVSPSSDFPFLFLGFIDGQILRYNMDTRVVNVLCCHTTGCSKAAPSEPGSNELSTPFQEDNVTEPDKPAGISSMALVRSGTSLLLIIGGQDRSLSVRSAREGYLIWSSHSAPQKGPPQGIASLHSGCLFLSYSDRSVRIHNWKTGFGVLTFQTQRITSACVMQRYVAVGDSEGAIRIHKIQSNGLPCARAVKVYFASVRAAITSLTSFHDTLIAGSLDGTITTIMVNEPVSDYTCLYGPPGKNCGIGFVNRSDLLKHVLETHLIFGNQKSVMCRWGAGRCRVRFTDTQTMKSISDHLLTHIPD